MLQEAGRRRTVANKNGTPSRINSKKSCKGGCDCAGPSKYSKGVDTIAQLKRTVPFAVFVFGIMILRKHSPSSTSTSNPLPSSVSKTSPEPYSPKKTMGNCELRKYPKTRYYGLDERPLPSFLDTEYIYGELPQMLELQKEASGSQASKLCVDQSEWYQPKKETGTSTPPLPFADGTNPSILKIDNPRIDSSIRKLLYDNVVGRRKESPYYLATICMTDSQCSWNDSPEEIAEFHLSTDKKPSTVRTILLVLNQNFETMMEATIYTKIDAPFNGRFKPNNQTKTFQLDDARLFTHNGQVWVSYREGKIFGYDKQVLNKIHFDFIDSTTVGEITDVEAKSLRTSHNHNNIKNKQLTATLLSSETETLCCGRNMALIDNVHTDELQALTWADPVTVVSVDTSKTDAVSSSATQRRLKKKGKKKKESHFHGTNGFMVHLPTTGEYLGIGHFHRPSGRDQNPHARFGHHYTHAFFTITDQPPFRLKRLSAELVLPSYSYPEDTEIIQFWSGLELDGTTLALAYGINDCEGAATRLDLAVIEGLLRDVPEGKEVVDLMMPQK